MKVEGNGMNKGDKDKRSPLEVTIAYARPSTLFVMSMHSDKGYAGNNAPWFAEPVNRFHACESTAFEWDILRLGMASMKDLYVAY